MTRPRGARALVASLVALMLAVVAVAQPAAALAQTTAVPRDPGARRRGDPRQPTLCARQSDALSDP